MVEREAKFWMVYGEGAGRPTYRHETKQSAKDEAKRLASCHPGRRFYVLQARSGFVVHISDPQKVVLTNANPKSRVEHFDPPF